MKTKDQAGYRRVPNRDKKSRCELCVNFRPDRGGETGSCVEVAGVVSVMGTCGRFTRRGSHNTVPGVHPQ